MYKYLFIGSLGVIATLLVILAFKSCKKEKPCPAVVSITFDSSITLHQEKVSSVPKLIKVIDTQYFPKPHYLWLKQDTFEIGYVLPVDTAAILKDYNAVKIFTDTPKIKRGMLVITDTLTKNTVIGHGIELTGTDTTITKTVTVEQEKKAALYLGFTGIGNKYDPFQIGGLSAAFKPQKEKYQLQASAMYSRQHLMHYQGTVLFKISFREK